MKLRTGFVSNSSSSSFIVSTKKGETPKLTVTIELPTDEQIGTIEELDAYFVANYGDRGQTIREFLDGEDGHYYKEDYEECLAEIKKGRTIHIGTVCSDGDNAEENMVYQMGLSGGKVNGKVIQDCQGG